MTRIVLFNKPYGVLTQFTDSAGRETLGHYIHLHNVYPAGRLDRDSEGLVVLTDDGRLQYRLTHPRYKQNKTYWVQVDGEVDESAVAQLRIGVPLKDGLTAPARVQRLEPPELWPRDPPIRYRKNVPTSWLELVITEGRNRQVRRMTAAVGHPTLRLIRYAIGEWSVESLPPGRWRRLTDNETLTALRRLGLGPGRRPHAPGRRRGGTSKR